MLGATHRFDNGLGIIPAGVPQPGTLVADKYVVESLIGTGGMGAVLAARRTWDGGRVALKVMLAEEAQHDDSTRRFFREARAAGVIDSPHVAKLLDFGRLDDGIPFMVLELLEGEAVDRVIRERAPLPIPEAIDYMLQACEGIAEAHARGIIHRDIKPSNLFVTTSLDGTPLLKVLDFGISKAVMKLDAGHDAPSLTETNATLGSPQYMSPEQLRSSKDVDSRTDIWSLGLILHKLLTGKPAFEAPNVGAHFAMILADPPSRLRTWRPDAPAALEETILMCLRKDRDERWQDLGQLATALAAFGPPHAAVRAARVVAILELAGVSSQSHPRLSFGPDAPTLREAPAAKGRSIPPGAPDSVTSIHNPQDGEKTTSAWSESMPAPRPNTRVIFGAAAGIALAVVAVGLVFGLSRLFSGDPAPSAPTTLTSSPDPRALQKAELIEKARAGTASADELRKLEAICVLDNDEACIALARANRAAATPAPAAATATSAPSASVSSPTRPRDAPSPKPAASSPAASSAQPPEPDPAPQPKKHVTPKGPMVDTL